MAVGWCLAACMDSPAADTGVSPMEQRAVAPHICQCVSLPFIAQVPGGAQQGAVLLCAIAGCSCVSPLTSPCLEGQSSSTRSAEVCFCGGVRGHVHSSAMQSKMEHSVVQHIAWSCS